jgi:hypothetical protein
VAEFVTARPLQATSERPVMQCGLLSQLTSCGFLGLFLGYGLDVKHRKTMSRAVRIERTRLAYPGG